MAVCKPFDTRIVCVWVCAMFTIFYNGPQLLNSSHKFLTGFFDTYFKYFVPYFLDPMNNMTHMVYFGLGESFKRLLHRLHITQNALFWVTVSESLLSTPLAMTHSRDATCEQTSPNLPCSHGMHLRMIFHLKQITHGVRGFSLSF